MESAAARCPRDVLVLVFKHLPPSSLKRCALVCKRWHAAASCDAVWARHVSARHDVNISSTLKGRWLHRDYLLRPRPAFADLPPYFPLADRHVLPGPLALLRFYLVDPVRLAAVIRPMRAKRCASRREYVRAQVRYMAPLVALVPTAMVMFAALRGEFPLERVVALVPGWLAATSVEGLVHEHVTGRPLGPLAPDSLVLPALLAAHLPQTERPLWVSMLRFGTFDCRGREGEGGRLSVSSLSFPFRHTPSASLAPLLDGGHLRHLLGHRCWKPPGGGGCVLRCQRWSSLLQAALVRAFALRVGGEGARCGGAARALVVAYCRVFDFGGVVAAVNSRRARRRGGGFAWALSVCVRQCECGAFGGHVDGKCCT